MAFSVTPTNGQAVTVYAVADMPAHAVASVMVAHTTDGWASVSTVTAAHSTGLVYTAAVPGYGAGTVVACAASYLGTNGLLSPGLTGSYTVFSVSGESIITTCRVMAANLTSGNYSSYEGPGIRIFQGLKPDVVAIQEFNYQSGTIRQLVDTAFGASYFYCRGSGSKPNGVVSRWPILASGEWNARDAYYPDREYSWATVDIPGPVDMHVVSVHLSTDSSERPGEARDLTNHVRSAFAPTECIVLAGDLNAANRTEAALTTLKTIFSDSCQPADQAANDNTSANRSKPLDYVLASSALEARQVPATVLGHAFPDGLVYDSRVSSPYSMLPPPVQSGDSGAASMQHMGVVKDFAFPSSTVSDRSPVLTPPANREVVEGMALSFAVIAADADGDMITLACSDAARFLAPGAKGAVTGLYAWTPGPGDVGDHAVIFTASANGKQSACAVNITVLPEPGMLCLAAAVAACACRLRKGDHRSA